MTTDLRASLVNAMQVWLDDNADALGGNTGIWQDGTSIRRNAEVMARAVECVIDAAALQSDLEAELGV